MDPLHRRPRGHRARLRRRGPDRRPAHRRTRHLAPPEALTGRHTHPKVHHALRAHRHDPRPQPGEHPGCGRRRPAVAHRCLKIPERDRFQIVTQHDPAEIIALDAGLGFQCSPGAVVVHIFTQLGRSTEDEQGVRRPLAGQLAAAGADGKDLSVSCFGNGSED
ncbi:tautomerase family protein [Streptomyces sp. NRRL S-340]|uniref:tautomerase family protein n=1 Tax=Streptomyces sp. NRRL S-340 TaxID=1463901 RepID=UPI001F197E15|nr:tautomerase family protein [Streptomyces sp. NRRL S-340]